MAIQSLTDLKALINSTIYDNPSQEISGGDVQTALINAIDTLDSAEGFVNVHKANGQTTITAYGSKSAARGAVPADLHYQGIVIAYKLSTGWLIEQNLDATAGTWGDDASWQTIGPVSVSQNTLSIGGEDKGELAGQLIENSEWVQVVTDSEDKILEGIKADGTKQIATDLEVLGNVDISGATYSLCQSPEWIKVLVDSQERIIAGVRTDGSVYIGQLDGIPADVQTALDALSDVDASLDERLQALESIISVTENPEFIQVTTP